MYAMYKNPPNTATYANKMIKSIDAGTILATGFFGLRSLSIYASNSFYSFSLFDVIDIDLPSVTRVSTDAAELLRLISGTPTLSNSPSSSSSKRIEWVDSFI
jgi:hypothetical protein